MKRIAFVLLTALWCLVLTFASASIRDEAAHREQIAQMLVAISKRDQILSEWTISQAVQRNVGETHYFANTASEVDIETSPTVKLPASLRFIENEAFEGTAIVQAVLPENLESIGERAFANIMTLRMIKIPESTKTIAETAFAGSNRLIITSTPGSYARAWAGKNGVLFTPILVVHAGTVNVQITTGTNHRKEQIDVDIARSGQQLEKQARWRPVSEIATDQYEEFIANHLSGRAPPASA